MILGPKFILDLERVAYVAVIDPTTPSPGGFPGLTALTRAPPDGGI